MYFLMNSNATRTHMPTEKTILLVDDDPNILQVAGFAVAKAGYRTISARNGAQALDQFRAEQPDLIVLDIVMPELDGVGVCRQIRGESNVPGISTGNRDKVFRPFFTTARETGGSGLGLSIVQALLHAHGGSISLEPSYTGASFRVRVPLS
jgi:CheY-like chemotaxis protein